jgi:hypothetical protein
MHDYRLDEVEKPERHPVVEQCMCVCPHHCGIKYMR